MPDDCIDTLINNRCCLHVVRAILSTAVSLEQAEWRDDEDACCHEGHERGATQIGIASPLEELVCEDQSDE